MTDQEILSRFVAAVPVLADRAWSFDSRSGVLCSRGTSVDACVARRGVNARVALVHGNPVLRQGTDRYYQIADGVRVLFQWDDYSPGYIQLAVLRTASFVPVEASK